MFEKLVFTKGRSTVLNGFQKQLAV